MPDGNKYTPAEITSQLRKIRRRRERAEQVKREATNELAKLIPAALDAGLSMVDIERESGYTRKALYDVRAGRYGRQ